MKQATARAAANWRRVYAMPVASVYPSYIAKAEKKGRTRAEVDAIFRWLTGHSQASLEAELAKKTSFEDFFAHAPRMTSKSHSAYTVGYNVQSVVDTKHHLIVTHEVTNVGIDNGHLSEMAEQAREALKVEEIEVLADKGYFDSEEIAACEDAGIDVYVPKRATSNARAQGRFDKDDFIYDREHDRYECPAGQQLTRRMTCEEDGRVIHVYWTNTCRDCPLKSDCTTGKERRVRRWEREDVLERAQARLDGKPDAMQLRRETVEHPFGTIKAWMGATHFKMKTLQHVAAEMALHVLAYNLKRLMAILGVLGLVEAITAFLTWLAVTMRPSIRLKASWDTNLRELSPNCG
jgi:hypothetical protein